jgi:acetoin utilization deacetylase AcuC-like enzyme
MYEYASRVAGSSLTAASLLISNTCKYTINWFGGWHHAKRFHLKAV